MAETKETKEKKTPEKKTAAAKSAEKKPAEKKSAKKSGNTDNGEKTFLKYKGKPLLRCGNTIYYGNPEDKYVVTFRLEDREPLEDLQLSKKVIVELKTNEGNRSALIRQAERDGLYKALDIGIYWLEQALENS